MESRIGKIAKGLGLLALLLSLGLAAPYLAQAKKPVQPPPVIPPTPPPAYCDSCNTDAAPPFLGYNQDPPLVMINASNDHQLFFKAYNDFADLDNDGLADTTYKDSITYYGYFDSSKCYDYNTSTGITVNGATVYGFFEPKALTDPAVAPAVPTHYCTGSNDAYWSGNFLNWAAMSRIDVIRKVLFGGLRRTDTATSTVLERAYLPHDAHSWAKYYAGNDLDKLTPFTLANTATSSSVNSVSSLATSVTSRAIAGSGNVSFTIASGVINNGDFVVAQVASDSAKFMQGNATVSGSTVTITVSSSSGSGTYSSWNLLPRKAFAYSGGSWANNDWVQVARTSDPSVYMRGQILASGGTIYLYVRNAAGTTASTSSDWSIINLRTSGITLGNTTDTDGSGYSQDKTDPPLIKVVRGNYSLWAGNERWQCTWASGAPRDNHAANNANVVTASDIYAYTDSPAYSQGVVALPNYIARVQVCVPGLIGKEKCKSYPGPDGVAGNADDNYKPIGLLQVYGDQDQMYFGMVAGTYDKHVSGGSLIRNMGSLKDEVNVGTDGTFKITSISAGGVLTDNDPDVGGLVNAWSLYRIVGYSQADGTYRDSGDGDNCDWGLSAFSAISGSNACTNWGNPFSEIFYQSVNYFSGNGVIGDYRSNSSKGISGLPVPQPFKDPLEDKNYCSRLNVVNFNSSISSYDADELDATTYKPTTIWDSNDLPGAKTSKAMTDMVGAGEGINGNSFFVGKVGATGNELCTPKTVGYLGDVLGICPDAPRLSGSYRIAGLAYYAHIKDIRPDSATGNRDLPEPQLINTYSVSMATSVPAIEIPNPVTGVKAVTILPACRNTDLDPDGNCSIVDFKVVSQSSDQVTGIGTGKFYINWEDSEQGGDYDQDMWGVLEYTINAATNKITVKTSVIAESTIYDMGFGYVINGTTQDGFHAHSGIEGYTYDDPATIIAGADCISGCQVTNAASTAQYTLGTASAALLKDPLWYASKWGGFKDSDNSGTPNLTKEWDRENNSDGSFGPDGIPDTYFYATNPGQIEPALNRAFLAILKSMASGSAASVISSSRSGEGALYQAVFWPGKGDEDAGSLVKWTGEVHALFVNDQGNTYEDSNENRQLDAADKKVVVFFDPSTEQTMACYGNLDAAYGTCDSTAVAIEDVKFLWSAADNLLKIPDGNITSNRSDLKNPADAAYISATPKRNIFTWNDTNKDGIVTPNEVLPFEENQVTAYQDFGITTDQAEMNKLINWIRGQDQPGMRERLVWSDANNDGIDQESEWLTWRLGDIINSTPMLVSRPAESYHFLYKDRTYAEFLDHYQDRRHVIYFGSNDGMLHAVNGGFYREKLKKFCLAGKVDGSDACVEDVATDPPLGAELWAYVPYNLAPHLKCLTSPDYCHKYYVDQRPRIFDARIFPYDLNNPEAGDHPYGWGTVLVGGMRFGGTPVTAATDLGLGVADTRVFASSYFFFDITNPEKPPVLLGEMTHRNGVNADGGPEAPMGYTTGIPTMVPMNPVAPMINASTHPPVPNNSQWHLVFGNGPTDLKGNSSLKPTFFVMPMDWLAGIGGADHELRFPAYTLTAENQRLGAVNGERDYGAFSLPATALCTNGRKGFVSDPITVDYELLADYKANVVYMGTVEHNPASPAVPDYTVQAQIPWYGEMYRMVTGERSYPLPLRNITQNLLGPQDWKVNLLIDVKRPITAPAAVGWDQTNYWVYFGTGRFFNSTIDTPDLTRQSYFGIKEPMVPVAVAENLPAPAYCVRNFSWATVEKTPLDYNKAPGLAGLLDVTNIKVIYDTSTQPITSMVDLSDCPSCPANLLALINDDPPTDDFTALTNYIAGTAGNCEKTNFGTDGWYRNFEVQADPLVPPVFAERNLGQATLLGGLLTFTTYSPKDQECQRLGVSTLYGLFYRTGTAWREPVFGGDAGLWGDEVAYKLDLGRGLSITPNLHVGGQEGSTAFVQTSTGAIVAVEQPNLPLQEGKTGRKSWFEGIPETPAP